MSDARAAIDTARQPYVAGIVSEFEQRCELAVRAVQDLCREASALSSALRSPVTSPIDRLVRFEPAKLKPFPSIEFDQAKLTILPGPESAIPPAIDLRARRVTDVLDRLDDAAQFVSSIAVPWRSSGVSLPVRQPAVTIRPEPIRY